MVNEQQDAAMAQFLAQQTPNELMMMQQNAEFSKFRLSHDDEFQRIIHSFKGEEWVEPSVVIRIDKATGERTQEVDMEKPYGWVKTADQLLNNKGVHRLVGVMEEMINKNTILTNLDDVIVLDMANSCATMLADSLLLNYDLWEVEFRNFPLIVRPLSEFYFSALRRAMDEGERRSMSPTIQERRIISDGHSQQRPGRLTSWIPFFKVGGRE